MQAKPGISGKQQQKQNSPNLGSTLLTTPVYTEYSIALPDSALQLLGPLVRKEEVEGGEEERRGRHHLGEGQPPLLLPLPLLVVLLAAVAPGLLPVAPVLRRRRGARVEEGSRGPGRRQACSIEKSRC